MNTSSTQQISFCFLALSTIQVSASELIIPNQFTSGTRALASEVNNNFTEVAVSVNDNHAQLTAILARLDALEAENTQLRLEVDALTSSQVVGLNDYLSIGSDAQGNPIAVFSGVNLTINNGAGQTNSRNGLGNFIIGYDEENTDLTNRCSRGNFELQGECEDAGGSWSHAFKTGSHNLVVGAEHNYSNYGGIVSGFQNDSKGFYTNILGGFSNSASGNYSSISGGVDNQTSGVYSHVSGGSGNEASASQSVVLAGRNNLASGIASQVSGGSRNEASGNYSGVGGGSERESSTTDSWSAGSLTEDF